MMVLRVGLALTIALFSFVGICANASEIKCGALLKADSVSSSISAGTAIYQELRDGKNVLLAEPMIVHGTSVEAVRRAINANLFEGSSSERFDALYRRKISKTMQVVYGYEFPAKTELRKAIRKPNGYAMHTAHLHHFLAKLGLPLQTIPQPVQDAIIDHICRDCDWTATIENARANGEEKSARLIEDFLVTTPRQLRNKAVISSRDLKGVAILFAEDKLEGIRVEEDPEIANGAVVLITDEGLPLSAIAAIVPLSSTDARLLLDLLDGRAEREP